MKRFTSPVLTSLVMSVLLLTFTFSLRPAPTQAQKANKNTAFATVWDTLDLTVTLKTGKRVFYVLTDEENGKLMEAETSSRKCLAFVTAVTFGERSELGHRVASLHILRAGEYGGVFDKTNVPFDNSRSTGTFDNAQWGDLVD